jgi:two-component system, LytTR family, response regulator LytT
VHILIIEDESVAARGLEKLIRELLGSRVQSVRIEKTLTGGRVYILDHPLDLVFLDLNLNGEDGFDILREFTADSFQTVIVSGNTEKALDAFTYGVLDFVPKPVSQERLALAIKRFTEGYKDRPRLKFLSVRKDDVLEMIPLENVIYFEGADNYVLIHMKNGKSEKTRKTLDYLEKIVNSDFVRLHRSYLADTGYINQFRILTGGKYEAVLSNSSVIPVSRNRYHSVREKLEESRKSEE